MNFIKRRYYFCQLDIIRYNNRKIISNKNYMKKLLDEIIERENLLFAVRMKKNGRKSCEYIGGGGPGKSVEGGL